MVPFSKQPTTLLVTKTKTLEAWVSFSSLFLSIPPMLAEALKTQT
jgi:hypothetical protein